MVGRLGRSPRIELEGGGMNKRSPRTEVEGGGMDRGGVVKCLG